MSVEEYKKITLKTGRYSRKKILNLLYSNIPEFELEIQCPKCKIKGSATIPTKLLQNNSDLLTITFVRVACEHCFKVYIDKQMSIRSIELSDFIVEKERKSLKYNIINKLKKKN